MMKEISLASEFKVQALMRMSENLKKITRCLTELDESEVWRRPNGSSNSVGNLLLHLSGNIRQYILAGIGGVPDTRTRDAEFSATEGLSKAELLQLLTDTVTQAMGVIGEITEPQLLNTKRVQVYDASGLGHVLHVVEHFSYHTGQITFWVKLLKNKDLGFYAGVNLSQTN